MEKKRSLINFYAGSFFFWCGFIMQIAAVATHNWRKNGLLKAGLTSSCSQNTCTSFSMKDLSAQMLSVLGLMVAAIVLHFFGFMLAILRRIFNNRALFCLELTLTILASLCSLAAPSVYVEYFITQNWTASYSCYLAWFGGLVADFGLVLALFS